MRKFSVIPDDHEGSPKQSQFKFHQAYNRLAINRIKLFDGSKNLEELGSSRPAMSTHRGSIITKNGHHTNDNNRDASVNHAHSLIESLRASKAALASGLGNSNNTKDSVMGVGATSKQHEYLNVASSQKNA